MSKEERALNKLLNIAKPTPKFATWNWTTVACIGMFLSMFHLKVGAIGAGASLTWWEVTSPIWLPLGAVGVLLLGMVLFFFLLKSHELVSEWQKARAAAALEAKEEEAHKEELRKAVRK